MRHPEPILHVDMDAFYASVEQRDDPSLRDKPVVVGGAGGRGVVAAASYESRRFGIRSAMPMTRARRLCPHLVVVSPRFDRYREVSHRVMAILAGFTPLVEPLSLDEAFLDVGGSVRLFGSPPQIGHRIRAEVRRELDLPCSVGVGPTKSVAKLLSGKAKPDGLMHWPVDEVAQRLRPLPVADLWGAGPRTVARLEKFGIRTIGDVAATELATLQRLVGAALGARLHQLAHGEDPRIVTPEQLAKSVSAEETFDVDIVDPQALRRVVLRLGDKVGRRLRRTGVQGRTITLKVRDDSFATITRSSSLGAPTDLTRDIVQVATDLLDALELGRTPVRLLGVGVSNLDSDAGGHQLTLEGGVELSDDRHGRWAELDEVVDRVTDRFGGHGVSFASLLGDTDEPAAPTREDRTPPGDPPS